jgi:Flp pilus assembly protein TadD
LVNDLGYHYYLQNRLADAERQFLKAAELKPDRKSAWTNLGLTFGQEQQFDQAWTAFQRGVDMPAQAHCNMGYVYSQANQLNKAQSEFRAALSLDPNLQAAAEGLLQVSAKIPGQEPLTVVSTIAKPKLAEADSADSGTSQSPMAPGWVTPAADDPNRVFADHSLSGDAAITTSGGRKR